MAEFHNLNELLKVSIREFLVSIIEERDRLYDMRFKASETAVNAALAAQEKAVTAAFLASEKAIVKAEDAQRDYNIRSNEFRGQLDDQAKTLMPRLEAATLFKSYEDKLEATKIAFDKAIDAIITDTKSTNRWVIGLVIATILSLAAIALRLVGK